MEEAAAEAIAETGNGGGDRAKTVAEEAGEQSFERAGMYIGN